MIPKQRVVQLLADYLEVEAMLSAFHDAVAPSACARWRTVARLAAADLACAAQEVKAMLTPWPPEWQVLASALANFGRDVALQLRDERCRTIKGRLVADARSTILVLCREIRDARGGA
jgi:hypothetical protein